MALSSDDVKWVVNDSAELGVEINGQYFFLYKGGSLVYGGTHDDGTPMHVRPVFKREFGECCHPVNYENLKLKGTVSLGDSDAWKVMPKLEKCQDCKGGLNEKSQYCETCGGDIYLPAKEKP